MSVKLFNSLKVGSQEHASDIKKYILPGEFFYSYSSVFILFWLIERTFLQSITAL